VARRATLIDAIFGFLSTVFFYPSFSILARRLPKYSVIEKGFP